MSSSTKIIVRPAEPSDKNLIWQTWLNGNYYRNPYYCHVPKEIYFKEFANQIKEILFTPGVEVHVACDQNIPTWVVGYAVTDESSIYWIYVKKDFRERGIATLLLQGKPITTAKSLTRIGLAITEKKGLIFNPF